MASLWHSWGQVYSSLSPRPAIHRLTLDILCRFGHGVRYTRPFYCHLTQRDSSSRFSYKVPYPKDLLTQCHTMDLWWRVKVLGVLTPGLAASTSSRVCFRWPGTLNGHTRCVQESPSLFLRWWLGSVGVGGIGCWWCALLWWYWRSQLHACDTPCDNLTFSPYLEKERTSVLGKSIIICISINYLSHLKKKHLRMDYWQTCNQYIWNFFYKI